MPDRGSQGQDALGDADTDAVGGTRGVTFEVELVFEGVEDRLDDLAQRLEELLARPRDLVALAVGPDQVDAARGELGLEGLAVVALVRHQRLVLQRVLDPGGQIG